MTPPDAPREGELVAGRFRVEGLVGRGAMGEVHRAFDVSRGEHVALKIMAPEADAARFAQEAEILASLDHAGIVRYVAHGQAGDLPFLAMEWLEGEDLSRRLARGTLGPTEALTVGRRAAAALAAAHERGVVHRDIKPENLFLVRGSLDDLRIVDFGVARAAAPEGVRSITRAGMLLGTPAYMAPEQARGSDDVDARADVYALGCVLFECLAARPPFEGLHAVAVLAKILIEEAPRLRDFAPDAPVDLEHLVERLLSKDRDARPADGAALVAALDALRGPDEPAISRPVPSIGRLEQRLTCVVLLDRLRDPSSVGGDLELAADDTSGAMGVLRSHAARFAARLEPLLDGSVVVVHTGPGIATDLLIQSARSALELRAAFPDVAMALTAGRAIAGDRRTVGEAFDRASALVAVARAGGGVRIDEVAAGFLATRFAIEDDRAGLVLGEERSAARPERTLLGRETPFVGRSPALARLSAIVEEGLARREPRAALVTAESGMGKSRLRYELFRRAVAHHHEAQVWATWGDVAGAGSPFGLVAPMLRRIAGIGAGDPPELRRRKLRACVARSVDEPEVTRVSELLGEVAGVPFTDDGSVHLRAARADAELLGAQLRRAFSDFVAAELGVHPVILLLEDLQWADVPSLELFAAALERARSGRLPLSILAFGRPEALAMVARSWSTAALDHVALGALDPSAAAELVRSALGAVSSETVTSIVERSGGNAFCLEELIRVVAEGRVGALPETALAVAEARIAALDDDARRLVRAASIFARPFSAASVAALLGSEEGDVGARLEELAQREVLARAPVSLPTSEADAWDFRHALIRDAAYAMLTDDDRVLGHRLAADWLERSGEDDAARLAEHFERGGERTQAATWYLRAAEQARDGNDLLALARRVEQGLRCGAEGELAGELHALAAEGLRWKSDNAGAAEAAIRAMRLLPGGSESWLAATAEAVMAHGRLGRTDEVVVLAGALLAVAPSLGPTVAATAALARTHEQLVFGGHYPLAREVLAALETLAGERAQHDPLLRVWLGFARADAALAIDDRGRYVELMEGLVAAFDAIGDERNAFLQRCNLADAYLNVGHNAEASALCRAALAAGARLTMPHAATAAKLNLARAEARAGRLDDARRLATQAADDATRIQAHRLELTCRYALAGIQLQQGDARGAELTLRTALAAAAIPRPTQVMLGTRLAEVLAAQGEAHAARPLARAAIDALEELGAIEEAEFHIRRVHVEVLAACGELDAARDALVQARDRLLAAGDRMDARWLGGFLGGVPDHARILELAAASRR